MTLFNPKPRYRKGKKVYTQCPCGNFFIAEGRGKRVFCDDCRARNKVMQNRVTGRRRKKA